MLYEKLLKPIFFKFDPERMHDAFSHIGEMIGNIPPARKLVEKMCFYEHKSLETEVCGMKFLNPIGLAAGFDKDVRLTKIIPAVGFGFMEVGSITQFSYEGNAGRRLHRLPKDKSIIVYFGLKNMGSQAIFEKIARFKFWKIPTGLSIAKTNRDDIKGEKSIDDYVRTYRLLAPYFSYVTINISCPNSQDGCTFQENPEMLRKLISKLENEKKTAPVFIKISNDMKEKEFDAILEAIGEKLIDGFVISNLSKDRSSLKLKSPQSELDTLPHGGISGKPVQERSDRLIRMVYTKTRGKYPIIGVGGVFSGEDAYRKIKAGASLIQLITGMIYRGPFAIKMIKRELRELLAADGYENISQAVGVEALKAGINLKINAV